MVQVQTIERRPLMISLTVIFISLITLVHGQDDIDQINCPVNIDISSTNAAGNLLEDVVVGIDDVYDSVTNGVAYGPIYEPTSRTFVSYFRAKSKYIKLQTTGEIFKPWVLPLTEVMSAQA